MFTGSGRRMCAWRPPRTTLVIYKDFRTPEYFSISLLLAILSSKSLLLRKLAIDDDPCRRLPKIDACGNVMMCMSYKAASREQQSRPLVKSMIEMKGRTNIQSVWVPVKDDTYQNFFCSSSYKCTYFEQPGHLIGSTWYCKPFSELSHYLLQQRVTHTLATRGKTRRIRDLAR